MKIHSRASPPHSAKLFGESHPPGPPAGVHTAQIDGASRGNPGPAAYAVILRAPDGERIFELGKHLGRETNNVAEYYALITALDYAVTHGIRALCVRSDSELLVRQMQGLYKVKSSDLKPLHERARKLASSLDYFAIEHVRREVNREADRLANQTLDRNLPHSGDSAPVQARKSTPQKQSPAFTSQRIRANYVKGVLVPEEPLDLPEGFAATLDIYIPKKK